METACLVLFYMPVSRSNLVRSSAKNILTIPPAPLSEDVRVRIPFFGESNGHICSTLRIWNGLRTQHIDEMVQSGASSSHAGFVFTDSFCSPGLCDEECSPLALDQPPSDTASALPAVVVAPPAAAPPAPASGENDITHVQIYNAEGQCATQMVRRFNFCVNLQKILNFDAGDCKLGVTRIP